VARGARGIAVDTIAELSLKSAERFCPATGGLESGAYRLRPEAHTVCESTLTVCRLCTEMRGGPNRDSVKSRRTSLLEMVQLEVTDGTENRLVSIQLFRSPSSDHDLRREVIKPIFKFQLCTIRGAMRICQGYCEHGPVFRLSQANRLPRKTQFRCSAHDIGRSHANAQGHRRRGAGVRPHETANRVRLYTPRLRGTFDMVAASTAQPMPLSRRFAPGAGGPQTRRGRRPGYGRGSAGPSSRWVRSSRQRVTSILRRSCGRPLR
jgi:hypothetical protein